MANSTVTLNFPNPSRSYDASRHCVCFWGYDNSREITFLVDDAMLAKLNSDMDSGEPALLAAFDRNRDRILGLARDLTREDPRTGTRSREVSPRLHAYPTCVFFQTCTRRVCGYSGAEGAWIGRRMRCLIITNATSTVSTSTLLPDPHPCHPARTAAYRLQTLARAS